MGDHDRSSPPSWEDTDDGSPESASPDADLGSGSPAAEDSLASQEMAALTSESTSEVPSDETLEEHDADSAADTENDDVSPTERPQTPAQSTYQPSLAHSLAPPPAISWTDLSNAAKLVLVRELTTWYTFRETMAMLQLTDEQESAFRQLYNAEMHKTYRYETEMQGYMGRVATSPQGYNRLVDSISANLDQNLDRSLDRNMDQHGGPSSVQQSERLATAQAQPTAKNPVHGLKTKERVPPPDYETDHISMRDFDDAWRYLERVGFDARSVDLAHWTSHSGVDRFIVEVVNPGQQVLTMGTSHHRCVFCTNCRRQRTEPFLRMMPNLALLNMNVHKVE